MSVLLVILAGLVALAPLSAHQAMEALLAHEKEQIRLDNAGIRLGRKLREIRETQEALGAEIAKMERRHHEAHLCGEPCWESDQLWESHLGVLSTAMEYRLRELWSSFLALASRENCLGLPFGFPFVRSVCPLCAREWIWVWREGVLPIFFELRGDAPVAPLFLCLPKNQAQYWMFADRHRGSRFCRGEAE